MTLPFNSVTPSWITTSEIQTQIQVPLKFYFANHYTIIVHSPRCYLNTWYPISVVKPSWHFTSGEQCNIILSLKNVKEASASLAMTGSGTEHIWIIVRRLCMKSGWWNPLIALQDLAEAIHSNHPSSPILEFNKVHTTDEISAGPK